MYSGSRVDRCAVSTTDSPRSSSARPVCDPIEPRPPVMRTARAMIATLGRDRSPLLYETAIPGSQHRDVGRSVVVPAAARSARLREELAGRHAQEPATLAAEVCLVVVPGLNGPPCEIDV